MFVIAHSPTGVLAGVVESLVHSRGYAPVHDREIVLPDGVVQIIVDLTERPKRLFENAAGPAVAAYRGAWIAGIRTRPIVIEAQPGASFFVIRFTATGAHEVLGDCAGELGERVESLEAVAGRQAANLRERLLDAGDPVSAFRVAEDWLTSLPASQGGGANRLVRHLAGRIGIRPGLRIGMLAEEAGVSERHVHACFRRVLGISPKHYQQITRFHGVLDDLSRERGDSMADRLLAGPDAGEPDWAALAACHGFADQSHLTREFRRFSGLSPGRYARAYRGLKNHLPVGGGA
ncbi:MAG: helix-turn-helix domain-containing protein [Pseudomonadota bacterium]|nr:helix-turn-helix domain-containing protein [Pseudomonadota bacterium]